MDEKQLASYERSMGIYPDGIHSKEREGLRFVARRSSCSWEEMPEWQVHSVSSHHERVSAILHMEWGRFHPKGPLCVWGLRLYDPGHVPVADDRGEMVFFADYMDACTYFDGQLKGLSPRRLRRMLQRMT